MAAPCVEATVTLKSGEQRTIQHKVDNNDGSNQYKQLRENVKKLQGDVNAYLTQQVEREKAENKPNAAGDSQPSTVNDFAEDENEDDDITEETDKDITNRTKDQSKQPPTKKQKT